MSAEQMVPMEGIEDIYDGEFIDDVNTALQEIIVAMRRYANDHSSEDVKKAKAEVLVKIEVACPQPEHDMFRIGATIKTKVPNKPEAVMIGIANFDQLGTPCLLIRRGIGEDDPRQGRLFEGQSEYEDDREDNG